jgi:hypothetical protein
LTLSGFFIFKRPLARINFDSAAQLANPSASLARQRSGGAAISISIVDKVKAA